jgi:hypothetical protein
MANEFVAINDWGGYDYDRFQVEALHENGAGLLISQATGPGTKKLLARARGVGELTGKYWWNSPIRGVQEQIDSYSKAIEDEGSPEVLVIDFEHWWRIWQQYWDASGKVKDAQGNVMTWDKVEKFEPKVISENGRLVTEGIVKRWKGKYILDYSAPWFTYQYCPMAVEWLKDYPYFGATYPDYGVGAYDRSWDQIKNGDILVKNVNKIVVPDNLENYKVALPDPRIKAEMWQYSSCMRAPGEAWPYDWGRFLGNMDQLKAKCGLGPVPLPVPLPAPLNTAGSSTPELTLESLDARVRKIERLPWYQQFFPVIEK